MLLLHNSVNKDYFSAGNCSKHAIVHLIGDLNAENVVIENNLSNYGVKQGWFFSLCMCVLNCESKKDSSGLKIKPFSQSVKSETLKQHFVLSVKYKRGIFFMSEI